jgi:hypothetical protein
VQRGPVTQENGKFSRMGRHSKNASYMNVPQMISRLGHIADVALPGAVLGGIAGDEFDKKLKRGRFI